MACVDELLARLDEAVENFEFPLWECGEENAVMATMRASGFRTRDGAALVFEDLEHTLKEGVIQSVAYCVATFPISAWTQVGDSVFVSVTSSGGKLPFGFGEVEVSSRERSFSLHLERDRLVEAGYLAVGAKTPSAVSLLLAISDTVPRDWLFSTPEHLKETFEMPDDAQLIFTAEEWMHPTFNELYADGLKPSSNPDMRAMVKAVCARNRSPRLAGTPNTSWSVQCREH